MLLLTLLFILFLLATFIIYKKGRANQHYFDSWSIKYTPPKFIFGHSKCLWMRKQNMFKFIKEIYEEFPEEKASAVWDMRSPTVLIRDVQLVKQITVKELDHFMDHKSVIDEKIDPLLGNSLGAMKGQRWKDMRSTLSPAFTGSKMRLMFQLMTEVSEQLVEHLTRKGEAVLECDMKDLTSKYANDVIAICAFGIKVDTLKDEDNAFYKMAKSVMNFGSIASIFKFMILRFAPPLAKALKLKLLSAASRKFFTSAVLDMMEYRERNHVIRPDMINLLMDAKKGKLKHNTEKEEEKHSSAGFATIHESEIGRKVTGKREWTDDEMVSQCLVFFLAGFENNSAIMTIAAYELVVNPEVQERLYQEVKATQEELADKTISYEVLQGMKYLDNVVTETLRKWPPAAITDRVCTRKFDYTDEETGLEMHFEKGDNIWIPIYGFHHDAKYFAEPEKFIPERFNEENREMINPDAYLPFGAGARACIASRFALMEVKALLYHLVLNFEFVAVEKTKIPLVVKNDFSSFAKDIFIGMKKRTGES